MYPAKLKKYNTGESVFIRHESMDMMAPRCVFKINGKRCVIYRKNLYRLGKKMRSTIQPVDYYDIIYYRKISEVS